MHKAILHAAFAWDCEHCGKENFARAVEGNLDEPIALASGQEQVSIHLETVSEDPEHCRESPMLIARVAIGPKYVACSSCGTSFVAELDHTIEEEEDDQD